MGVCEVSFTRDKRLKERVGRACKSYNFEGYRENNTTVERCLASRLRVRPTRATPIRVFEFKIYQKGFRFRLSIQVFLKDFAARESFKIEAD